MPKKILIVDDGGIFTGRLRAAVESLGVEVLSSSSILAAVGEPGSADYGYVWHVRLNEYGLGKDKRIFWPKEPIVAAFPLIEGARVFALNDSQHQAGNKPFGKSVKEIVGWLKNPIDTGSATEADLYILKSAKWLRDGLVDSHERGNPNLFGLSFDVAGQAAMKTIDGQKVKVVTTITGVELDVVYNPTNNGQFMRMAAAAAESEENEMKREQLLAALAKVKPGLDTANLTDDQLLEALTAAATAVVEKKTMVCKSCGKDCTPDAEGKCNHCGAEAMAAASRTTEPSPELLEMRQLVAAQRINNALEGSKLPAPCLADLRTRFAGQCPTDDQLQAAIKVEKEKVDQLTGSGIVLGSGDVRVHREGGEKLQAAVDTLFGVKVDDKFKDVSPFTSLRAAYTELTGDVDVRGHLDPVQTSRMQAAFGSATFAFVLGNTLYRRLVQDYKEIPDYGVSRLVGSNIRNARDFRTLESVRIGYYGDLPAVDPENEDYADLGTLSDEQIEYAIGQNGGIITITRKMIINDDQRAVQKILSRLPRAARRGLARQCFTPFISNAVYKGDNKAIFHADHNNLGTAAYSIAAALAGKTALSRQTEPGSGERLMLRPKTVCHPSELYGIVKNVNDFNPQAVAIADGNSMYGFFKAEDLCECPFMVDPTDWMFAADPNECEILELAFLNGQQEPEMFVADQPTNGQMFVGDKIQYKIRHEYKAEVVDYRGVYKGVVAG